jgi:hypothetical protein
MSDEIKIEELSEEEKEKRALEWEKTVRSKVNSYLDMYLPVAKNGIVGVKYNHPIKEKTETEVTYKEDKAVGVNLAIGFEFIEEFDVPKKD